MSFLKKLKKNMGATAKETKETNDPNKPALTEKIKSTKILVNEGKTTTTESNISNKTKEEWFEQEGELAVDIYQTENKLIIQTAVAGIKPEDLDITIERDIITIKGVRRNPFDVSEKKDYFIQECYWGAFSRKIILPVEINPDNAEAIMKDGVLTIHLSKISREKKRKIEVKD